MSNIDQDTQTNDPTAPGDARRTDLIVQSMVHPTSEFDEPGPTFVIQLFVAKAQHTLSTVLDVMRNGLEIGEGRPGVLFNLVASMCSSNHLDGVGPVPESATLIVEAIGSDPTELHLLAERIRVGLRSRLTDALSARWSSEDTLHRFTIAAGHELGRRSDLQFSRFGGGGVAVGHFTGRSEAALYRGTILREVRFGIDRRRPDSAATTMSLVQRFCTALGGFNLAVAYMLPADAAPNAGVDSSPATDVQWTRIGFASQNLASAVEADLKALELANELDAALWIYDANALGTTFEERFACIRTFDRDVVDDEGSEPDTTDGTVTAALSDDDSAAVGAPVPNGALIQFEGPARPGLIGELLTAISGDASADGSTKPSAAPEREVLGALLGRISELSRHDLGLDREVSADDVSRSLSLVRRVRMLRRMTDEMLAEKRDTSTTEGLRELGESIRAASPGPIPYVVLTGGVLFGRTYLTVALPEADAVVSLVNIADVANSLGCTVRLATLRAENASTDQPAPPPPRPEPSGRFWVAWRCEEGPDVMRTILETVDDHVEGVSYVNYGVSRVLDGTRPPSEGQICAGKVQITCPVDVFDRRIRDTTQRRNLQAALATTIPRLVRNPSLTFRDHRTPTIVLIDRCEPNDEPWASLVAWDFIDRHTKLHDLFDTTSTPISNS